MNRRTRAQITPYLLILPAAAVALLFIYGVINGVLQGFGIMPALGLDTPTLEYYFAALTRDDLAASVRYSLYLATVSAVFATIGGVVLSAVLTKAKTGRMGYLLGVQVPLMTAHIIVVLVVISLCAGTGLVARVLFNIGLIGDVTDFPTVVGAPSGWGIIIVYLWKEIPFIAFCTYTLMSNISDRYSEAAASLGASPLRTFFQITLPLCKNAITRAFLIVFAFAFGAYEVPFLLGATLPKALPVLAYIQFQSPDLLNRPYAMALNGIMTGITLILALIYFWLLRREAKPFVLKRSRKDSR